MSMFYLIRHGATALTGTGRCVGGGSDPPLSPLGKQQSAALRPWFSGLPLTQIHTSTLCRCRETAASAFPGVPVKPHTALNEVHMGLWEGRLFSELRCEEPELYEQRGRDEAAHPAPGGETYAQVYARCRPCAEAIAHSAPLSVLVAHSTVNRLLLCYGLKHDIRHMRDLPQPPGCLNLIAAQPQGWKVLLLGYTPQAAPCEEEISHLFASMGTPQHIRTHCTAVQRQVLLLTDALLSQGVVLDRGALSAAALLHDLCRAHSHHALNAAALLRQRGWPYVADLVALHHDLPSVDLNAPISEAELLYLSDKLIDEDAPVPLQVRFSHAQSRCHSSEAIGAWYRRRAHAFAVYEKISRQLGGSVPVIS